MPPRYLSKDLHSSVSLKSPHRLSQVSTPSLSLYKTMSAPLLFHRRRCIDHSAASQAIRADELSHMSDTTHFQEDYPSHRGLSGPNARLAEYSRSVYLHTHVLWLEARKQAELNKKVGHFSFRSVSIRFDPVLSARQLPARPSQLTTKQC